MNLIFRLFLVAALLRATTACSHTMPLISHAHIGHSLDYWHDTPNNMGLYQVANREMRTAFLAVDGALEEAADESGRRQGLSDALHALDPDHHLRGPGLGYGAIRAWNGAIDHFEFAATSDDASDNVITTIATLAAIGDEVGQKLLATRELGAAAMQRDDIAVRSALTAMRQNLLVIYQGYDANEDGHIAPDAVEGGVVQLVEQLNLMLGREVDPSYQPLPRRYVLGLIRLPNGTWGFRLPGARRVTAAGYGY